MAAVQPGALAPGPDVTNKKRIVSGFESVNATDMDHHIQYGSVTLDSFYTSYSGILGHFYTS
jgi:hypothetical protein